MGSAALEPARFKAILFDVDGTLYRLEPVRRALVYRLLRAHFSRPKEGLEAIRALRAYRAALEHSRVQTPNGSDLAQHQVQLAADWTGIPPARVRSYVTRWMEREPLDLLRRFRRDGLSELLTLAGEHDLRLAVCSDYPAMKKLAAMGVTSYFDAVVQAQDADVQRFKPDPRILQVALSRLGVREAEALYVGDRPEVDAETARRAGVVCAIIGRARPSLLSGHCVYLANLHQLAGFLTHR